MVAFPLKASANSRYLVDQNNVPFFINGDAAWSLESQCTNADIDTYLKARAALGFNAILVEVIEHKFADHAPNNIDNVPPFTGATWTTPNSTYFSRIDHILSQAALYGICVFLVPVYVGALSTTEGWVTEIAASSTADMQSWASYLATRYGATDNLVWVIGGDYDPANNATVKARLSDFAVQLATSDTRHLITAHNHHDDQMGVSPWTSATWFSLNSTYGETLVSLTSEATTAYAHSPTLPFFQIESQYEFGGSMTEQQIRTTRWWPVLAGACGHVFGNNPMWYFSWSGAAAPDAPGNADWHQELQSPGALAMQASHRLLSRRRWHDLVPDTAHAVLTAGYGTAGGVDYVGAAATQDGALLVAYLPTAAAVTVNFATMASVARARWFDPTNAASQEVSGSPFVNAGSRVLTPPATNAAGDADWVLLVEALEPGMPGSWVSA